MSITVTVDFTFKSEEGAQQLVAVMKERLPFTRDYDGCEAIELFVDQENPRHLILIEAWESGDKYDAYLAWAMSQEETQALTDQLEQELSIQRWEQIPT